MGWSLAYCAHEQTARCHPGSRVVDRRLITELARIDRAFADHRASISRSAYEARVALRLNPGRAHYSETLRNLYFVDYRDRSIEMSLSSVYAGHNTPFECTLISSDVHGFFRNGYRVPVPVRMRIPVFTVLRLLGIYVSGFDVYSFGNATTRQA